MSANSFLLCSCSCLSSSSFYFSILLCHFIQQQQNNFNNSFWISNKSLHESATCQLCPLVDAPFALNRSFLVSLNLCFSRRQSNSAPLLLSQQHPYYLKADFSFEFIIIMCLDLFEFTLTYFRNSFCHETNI